MDLTPELRAKVVVLEGLVERACRALERFSPEELWSETRKLEVSVGTDFNEVGAAVTYDFPRNLFSGAAQLAEALARRTLAARTIAFPLHAALDPAAAAPLFGDFLHAQLKGFWAMSYEAGVMRAVCAPWHAMTARLPPSTMASLWLAGAIDDVAGLTDEQIAAIELDALVVAILSGRLGYLHRDEAQRIVEQHPALATPAAQTKLLDDLTREGGTRTHAAIAFLAHLTDVLVAQRYPAATAIFVRMMEQNDEDHRATDALVRLGHPPALARLASLLPVRLAQLGAQPWDPHHVAFDLTIPLRAAFALDPATATERFAPFFTAEAVGSDAGAKVAHDILSIGRQIVVDHDGTRLTTGDRDHLSEDPRWMAIAARLALHPRLGPTAKALLRRLPLAQRRALLATATPDSETPTAAARKRSAGPARKKPRP